MDIKCYLAMTAAELSSLPELPRYVAYLGCHFSSSGQGLSNLPVSLLPGTMVVIDDLMPPQCHDPKLIAEQLTQLVTNMEVSGFILDFQRPNTPESETIATYLMQALPCPVGVTPGYAEGLNCPVFLPPPPLHTVLEKHIAPWKGREIWLEAATDTCEIIVTREGGTYSQIPDKPLEEPSFYDAALRCRYHTEISEDHAVFTLHRGKQELFSLLQEAQSLGIKCAVGLYQQLNIFP